VNSPVRRVVTSASASLRTAELKVIDQADVRGRDQGTCISRGKGVLRGLMAIALECDPALEGIPVLVIRRH